MQIKLDADRQRRIFAKNLNHYMERTGKTTADISTDLSFPFSTVSDWVHGKKYPRMDKVQALADYFGILKSNLTEAAAANIPPGFDPLPGMSRIPVVGQIACGQPITAEENIEGYASAPEQWRANFALICRGRSMEPKIMDGDLVAIRSDIRVETGQIAAVRIGDEATLKKIYFYPERIVLRPINDEFKDIVFEGEEMNKVSIEGKAVGLCRNI